ncbi:MAG: ABC transporter substrate-binding protein [Anaerolineaceae bacterium]|nr:ABC transporter substrate-binding protein [Anaerolineaceae bacterium]
MNRNRISIVFALIFLIAATACTPRAPAAATPTAAPLTPVIFMAGYKPQASLPFVGAYVAKEKGYFEEEGLDVTIQHSPGKGEHLQLLAAGKIQITNQDAAILLQRRAEPGLPLVSFALLGQRGQQAFAALSDSGMTTPKDWEGHTVGYKGTPPPELFALIKAAGADVEKIQLVNVGFDPRVLTERQVDVYPVFKSNEPFLIQSWGYKLTLWDPADYGVSTLGLTYVTSDEILKAQPEMLTGFLRAALKGIQFASENLDDAVKIVMQYTGPETDPDHMRFMLEAELKDAAGPETEQHGLGWQTLEQWQAQAKVLADADLPVPEDVRQVFTTQILEAAASPR